MTKTQALQEFFENFNMNAYPITAVPDDTVFPWLTYQPVTASFGDGEVNSTVDLWFHSDSEAVANRKVEEISSFIGLGGVLVGCDNGAIWIKRGSPFSIPVSENDNTIKRRQLNITIEYLTY